METQRGEVIVQSDTGNGKKSQDWFQARLYAQMPKPYP
jgi:hypothetical protein